MKSFKSCFDIGGKEAKYTLIHIVETVGAMMYGNKTSDHETSVDEQFLLDYKIFRRKGFKIDVKLGFGKPGKAIAKVVNEGNYDLLIMGTHGHTGFKDLIFGTTVDNVRHKIAIPLFIVKLIFEAISSYPLQSFCREISSRQKDFHFIWAKNHVS